MEFDEIKVILEKCQNAVKDLDEKFQIPAFQTLLDHYLSVEALPSPAIQKTESKQEPRQTPEHATQKDLVTAEPIEKSTKQPTDNRNKIAKFAKDADIPSEVLEKMFDFEANLPVPPILAKIEEKSLSAQQRTGVLILLYANSVSNDNNQLKSRDLGDLLEKSKISPKNLFNAFPPGGSEDVQKEGPKGQIYRITRVGRMKAREILKKIGDTQVSTAAKSGIE